MRAPRIACLIIVIGCAVVLTLKPAASQASLILPTDLVFMTWDMSHPNSNWVLDRVDAETQQISVFYANPFGDVGSAPRFLGRTSLSLRAVPTAGNISQDKP